MIYFLLVFIAGCFVLKGSGRLARDSRYTLDQNRKSCYRFSCEKLAVFLVLLLMCFLTAFRGETVGNDTAVYLGWFRRIADGSIHVFGDSYMEKGFLSYLFIIANFLGTYPQIMLIVSAAVCYVFIGHYIFDYSKNYYLSLCLVLCFLFSVFTNELRQGMAAVIGVYGYSLLKGKKYGKSALVILLAATFSYISAGFICFISASVLSKRLYQNFYNEYSFMRAVFRDAV